MRANFLLLLIFVICWPIGKWQMFKTCYLCWGTFILTSIGGMFTFGSPIHPKASLVTFFWCLISSISLYVEGSDFCWRRNGDLCIPWHIGIWPEYPDKDRQWYFTNKILVPDLCTQTPHSNTWFMLSIHVFFYFEVLDISIIYKNVLEKKCVRYVFLSYNLE